MIENTTTLSGCVICKNPCCSNPKSGFFILDPDTLEHSGSKYILGAPRNGISKVFKTEPPNPLPHLVKYDNRVFFNFKGKFNESAWIRCAKILQNLGQIEASNYSMELAHRFYQSEPSFDEKIKSLTQLYEIMYPDLEISNSKELFLFN